MDFEAPKVPEYHCYSQLYYNRLDMLPDSIDDFMCSNSVHSQKILELNGFNSLASYYWANLVVWL
jgi:hypothetical protein